jgi:hypothetical protein
MREFLIGYGSLMNIKSLNRTIKMDQVTPVIVSGFKRSWIYNCRNEYTAVSVERSPDHHMNAVLIPVTSSDLYSLDKRELHYARGRVHVDAIFGSDSLVDAIVWIYETPSEAVNYSRNDSFGKVEHPTIERPIPQSYIDCIIEGCLFFGVEFAKEFVDTTHGFFGVWVNDREMCLAHRKYKDSSNLRVVVDMLLSEVIPLEFSRRLDVNCCGQ